MSTDGGDIRFTFTGDSSGLNSELEKIDKNLGEVSRATAGASNGLEKGFTKGAKAADKAADNMTASISKAKKEMDSAADSAGDMAESMDDAGDSAGGVDSQLSAVGGALGQVSPAMGEMAGTAGDAAGALEGVVAAAQEHPAAFAAVTVAVIAVGFAFQEATEKAEDLERAMEKTDRRQEKHQKLLADEASLLAQVQAAYDASIEENTDAATAAANAIDKITVAIHANRVQLQKAIADQVRAGKITEQEGQKQQNLLTERSNEALDLAEKALENKMRQARKEEELAIRAQNRKEEEIAASKAAAKAAERRAQADADALKAASDLLQKQEEEIAVLALLDSTIKETDMTRWDDISLAKHAAQEKIDLLDAEISKLDEKFIQENFIREKQATAVLLIEEEKNRKIKEAQDALDAELFAKEKAAREKRKQEKADELADDIQKRDDAMSAATEVTGSLMEITSLLEEEMTTASIEERKRLFAIQKGASIAEATINGAVAITSALKMGPVAGAIASAAIAATTAAQISMIAQQEPAFDTGGMVRGGLMARSADQMSARVLPGEAILNRSAADRLGEGGVNALNRGSSLGGVTVVPAYRHFDRFIRDEYRRGGSFRRIVTKERDFPVGQRRY